MVKERLGKAGRRNLSAVRFIAAVELEPRGKFPGLAGYGQFELVYLLLEAW